MAKSSGYVFKSRDYIGSAEPPATVLEDESRWGNDGTFLSDGNPDWIRESSGLWTMDFSNDYIDFGKTFTEMQIIKAFTIVLWIKSDAPTGTNFACGTQEVGGTTKVQVGTLGSAYLAYVTTAGVATATGGTPDTAWHLLTTTYDGAKVRLYEDTTLLDDPAQTGDLATAQGDFHIGRPGDYLYGVWDGKIALPKVLNRALSAGEIKQIYEAGRHWFGV